MKLLNFTIPPTLTLVTALGYEKIGAQKIKKKFFFQDKFFSLKAHAYYFIVLI